jgi:hypothetical protein
MIDPSLRKERLEAEVAEKDVAVIMLDVVLGYGSHPDMGGELVAALQAARKKCSRMPLLTACITGTQDDPQNYRAQQEKLEQEGVIVFPSNVSMVQFVKKCYEGRK